jgi:hypothetical protein
MGRGPLLAYIVVMCVAAVSATAFLLSKREVIASTPSAYTGPTVPLPLPAGSEACADSIVFDTRSGIARFGATSTAGNAAPDLRVTAKGDTEGAFRNDYRSTTRVPGGWQGTRRLDVPLTPPRTDSFGILCVRNLGDVPVDLVGSVDGRAYSRPTVRIDGKETEIELQLRLMERGRHSLLARIGQTTKHASTLNPFGPWWWWLLGLALITVTPVAVYCALRGTLAADAARGLDRDVVRTGLSHRFERLVPALARIPGSALVTAAAALAVPVFAYWSLSTHVFQADEDQYVYLSRWLQTDFPASLWNLDIMGRGLQRLEVWLLAVPSALFDSPWSLRGGRLLNVLAYVSTAIPIYRLGRGLKLTPQWAALPAVLSIAVPWGIVTTGFLTENIAYPACLWAVWAIWRTAATPAIGRDIVALVMVVVAGAARSGLLLLVPVLPLVVATVGLRYASGGLLARVRTVLRQHLVLWCAVAFGLFVLIGGAAGIPGLEGIGKRLAGGYATPVGIDVGRILSHTGGYLSKVVIGTGFLPAAIGLPWLAVQLVRPRDRDTLAFTVAAAITALGIFYSLNGAGPDERYVIYFAPLVVLPATLALARREVSAAGLAITSVLLGLLLLRVPWTVDQGPFGYFVSPVEMFYTRAVGLRLDRNLPGDFGTALAFAAFALAAAGVALALVVARRRALVTPGRVALLVTAVVLIIPLQTQYALSKYVNGAGSKSAPSDRARAFADTHVPPGATVGEFAEGVGQLPSFFSSWQEVQFYNQRIDRVYALGDNVNPVPPGDGLVQGVGFDLETGRVASPTPLPDYLAIPTQVGETRVRGEVVASLIYLPVALIRVAKPATLDWSAEGFDAVGNVAADAPGKTRFYGTGRKPGSYCGSYALLAPPDKAMAWRIDVAGSPPRSGSISPGQLSTVEVSLPDLVEKRHVDVRISGDGVRVAGIGVSSGC